MTGDRPGTQQEKRFMSVTMRWFRTSAASTAVLAAAMLGSAPSGEARVTRIVVDEVVSPAFDGQVFGAAGAYETVAGRAFGELGPRHDRNALIQDIGLGRDADGQGRHCAPFFPVKPGGMGRSSRLPGPGRPH